MKLIDVEYTFDNNKVLFYFTADGRIQFRGKSLQSHVGQIQSHICQEKNNIFYRFGGSV
mgnify:CR=1 FL=1